MIASAVGGQKTAYTTNTGTTWTANSTGGVGNYWNTAASLNGKKMVIAESTGYIYVSQDSGATWTQQTSAGSRAWEAVGITPDGKTIIAGASNVGIWVATGT